MPVTAKPWFSQVAPNSILFIYFIVESHGCLRIGTCSSLSSPLVLEGQVHSLLVHTAVPLYTMFDVQPVAPPPTLTQPFRYRYHRLWWANLLGSQATMLVLYCLLMASLIASLGCVPVLSSFSSSKAGSSGGGSGGGGDSPAPGGGGSGGSSTPQPMWLQVSLHIANGLVMMGIVGIAMSVVLGVLRACGYTGMAFLPDAFCPGCVWCLDLNGGPGLGWAPFIDCGAAGECGLALLVILVVVMLVVGIMAAAYMLYAVLWALVQRGLDTAQSMVENVQQEQEPAPAEAKR